MRAIQITEFGGPEVLNLAEVPDPQPAEHEFLINVSRAGVNYADTHQAENSYLAPTTLPIIPGGEVVGMDEKGRRVVALINSGGYAEKAAVSEFTSFDIPDSVSDSAALALIVQGTTAWLLLRKTAHIEEGDSVVVHAGAGGVGSIAVQLAKAWGAGRVIASASSPEKRDLTLDLGADAAIDSTAEDMTAAIREANAGKRVDVILDMTGGRVTDQSLAALAPFGRLAYYGQASRQAPKEIQPASLLAHSTAVGGMWLPHAFRLRDHPMQRAMAELIEMVQDGTVKPIAGGEYGLSEARQAHEALRGRGTIGKLVLDPSR